MSSPAPMSDGSAEEIVLPHPLAELSVLLDTKPEALATSDKDIRLAALQATKYVFDTGKQLF